MLKRVKRTMSAFVAGAMVFSTCQTAMAEQLPPVAIQIDGALAENLTTAPFIENNYVYISSDDAKAIFGKDFNSDENVSLRKVAEESGYTVGWDAINRTAIAVNKDKLLDSIGDFTIMDKYNEYSQQFNEKNYAIEGSFTFDINMSDLEGTVKIPVDGNGTITGLTSGNKAEMAIDINFDFSALADSLGEDVSSINLNNITVEYKMDLDSGLIYFHSAELQTALGVSADAWLSIDLQQILNLSGTDLNIADLMKKVQNGSYKDLVKTQVDAMSFNNVGDYEVAKSALSLFSDDTFTKNGNTYTSKSVVGNSEAGLSENTLILTVNDNDKVIAYSVTSKASVSNLISMEITASTDADLNSTAKLNYSIPGLVEMNMDMGMKYTETNDVTTGTVDENTEVIDLMGLLLASLTQAQMDISPSVTAE